MKLGVTFAEKDCDFSVEFGETQSGGGGGYAQGYTDGQKAEYDRLVDPTKIIEKTVSGSIIRVDDVSEIPHKCTVSVDKDATVTVCGKNLCTIDSVELKGEMCDTVLWSGSVSAPVTLSVDFSQVQPFTDGSTFIKYTVDGVINNISATALRNNGKLVISSGTITKIHLVNLCYISGVAKFQLETGTTASAYEPYKGESHTIIAGQAVEVDSICPTMTLFADNEATITFGYHKSYGVQTAYDRFWDDFQQNGNRTTYTAAFAGNGWSDETYNPKYPINGIDGNITYLFWNCYITDTKVPIIVTENNSQLSSVFANAQFLRTIRKMVFSEAVIGGATTWFNNCLALENITIEGTIAMTIALNNCSKLTNESVQSIIDHLKDLTGQTSQTIKFHSTVLANMTGEQLQAITDKNWTM